MIPHNPPPNGGMGTVIPFPSVATDSQPGADAKDTRRRLADFISYAERVLDFATVMSAALLANAFYHWTRPQTSIPFSLVTNCSALFALFFVLLLEKYGEYRPYLSLLAVKETERLLRVCAVCFLWTVPLLYLLAPTVSRALVLMTFTFAPTALLVEKAAVRLGLRWLRSRGLAARRAVILGGGVLAKNIYSVLARSPKLGLDPVAIIDEDAAYAGVEIHASSYHCGRPAQVLAGPLSARLIRNLEAAVLVIADPNLDSVETADIVARAASLGVTTYLVSRDYLEPGYWLEYSEVDGMLMARLSPEKSHGRYEAWKRLLDITVASLLLTIAAPLLILIGLLIRRTSPGPAIFMQSRVGRDGRPFWMYKFRSMYVDSPTYEYSPKTGADSRITPIGRFLRRTCLDEVPQLWNVLRGEMSLVGPRPEMPFITDRYTAMQRQRLSVTPGITGLWQLSGDRAYLIHENLEYDLYYIRNRNLFMDVAILMHSVIFAARGV